MNAKRAQEFLRREVGDSKLCVRWRNDIERFEIGRKVESLASDFVEWFYISSDGESGYRPIDMRTVRKIKSLDTWRREKTLKPEDFVKMIQEKKLAEHEEKREAIQYRLKHESRYIKKAAEK